MSAKVLLWLAESNEKNLMNNAFEKQHNWCICAWISELWFYVIYTCISSVSTVPSEDFGSFSNIRNRHREALLTGDCVNKNVGTYGDSCSWFGLFTNKCIAPSKYKHRCQFFCFSLFFFSLSRHTFSGQTVNVKVGIYVHTISGVSERSMVSGWMWLEYCCKRLAGPI